MKTSYIEWRKELQELYALYYPDYELSNKDAEAWREYYNDEYSPKDALYDEAQYD